MLGAYWIALKILQTIYGYTLKWFLKARILWSIISNFVENICIFQLSPVLILCKFFHHFLTFKISFYSMQSIRWTWARKPNESDRDMNSCTTDSLSHYSACDRTNICVSFRFLSGFYVAHAVSFFSRMVWFIVKVLQGHFIGEGTMKAHKRLKIIVINFEPKVNNLCKGKCYLGMGLVIRQNEFIVEMLFQIVQSLIYVQWTHIQYHY